MSKNSQKSEKFAVMRWINDGNRLSVHNLKYVSYEEYKPGMGGLSVFVEGRWKFRILKVGGKFKTDLHLLYARGTLKLSIGHFFIYRRLFIWA